MTLLAKIEAAGFTLAAEGDRLTVSPAGRLTDDQRAKIRANKARLLAELRARDLEALDRAVCARPPPSAVAWLWTPEDEDRCRPAVSHGSAGPATHAAAGGLYAGR
jgi:hypothetical protein